jgi:glycerol uptake facilitator-like aquaporin
LTADRKDVGLSRRLVAEALGTAFLLIAVVGSGIMGERLAGGNVAIALLANALATAAMLYVLIEWFAPVSGAHFNPLVTVAFAARGDIAWSVVPAYVAVQISAAILGIAAADLMFEQPVFAWSVHVRSGPAQWLAECIATFGLLGVIFVCSRTRPGAIAALVASYIGAAYWFTASTSFANPAVTIARAMTDTFAGIRPMDVPGFIVAQASGAIAAFVVFTWLTPSPRSHAEIYPPGLSFPAEHCVGNAKGRESIS